jgi:cell division protein FtsN
MVANNDSLHESILIKRAKRRLVGAVTILIILFSLSIFFLQDRSQVKELNKNVKVSFMQMGDDEINQSPDTFFKTVKKLEEDNENIIVSEKIETTKKVYLIQIGIFNNQANAEKLLQSIKGLGLEAQVEVIEFDGKEKVKLVTKSFESQNEAKQALSKIKSANLPGMIKVKNINAIY